jgi:hypothetical protein
LVRTASRVLGAVAVCATLALVIGVPTAAAHRKVFKTHIIVEGSGANTTPSGYTRDLSGHLTSANDKCLAGRILKLYFDSGQTMTLRDTDLSSQNGFWAVRGKANEPPSDGVTLKLLRKRIDRSLGDAHRHFCGGRTISGTFSPF